MANEELIAADVFCTHYNIDNSFINSLQQYGFIQVTTIDDAGYIPASQLTTLEKFVRLYYELDINLEGIEAITFLLQKVEDMQHEIAVLKSRLRLYESENI